MYKPVCNSGNVYFGVVGIDVVFYICISCIAIRATQGRPYRVADGFVGACLSSPFCNSGNVYFGVVGIDVVFYICISCIAIRATQGRPYKVADGFVGAGLSSPSAIPGMFILGLWALMLFSIFAYPV
ncbi:hypothetical protein HMPREF9130_1590 [Peptoniphilus sp. oral taxon 375 str. F0436]|nr:hypothetical protein HMPREF9130_1590 [Peptoniphilus sp. oral taxon 375 str. F0436]